MKVKIYSLYTLLCIIWGTTWVVLKVSLQNTPVFYGVGMRFIISGAILWIYFFYKGYKLPKSRTALIIYTQFAILNFTLGYGLTYWSTQYIYSNLGAILWAMFPLTVSFMAHLTLPGERLNPRKLFSISIGLIGVIMIVYNGEALGTEKTIYGIVGTLTAVVLASWPNVYLKKNPDIVEPIHLNVVSQSVAGLLLLAVSFIFESDQHMLWNWSNTSALLYLSVFGTVFAWSINIWLFKKISVMQISYIAFFPPVIAAVLGWSILDEYLSLPAILGGLLVLSGGILMNFKFRRRALGP
ncbi:MAG: EamA family transporter [Candidatus Neomarinimicrobiota bacterium]